MSVKDELSSDVAVALIGMRDVLNARDLKDVLELFRSTLSALSSDERSRRRARFLPEYPPDPTVKASWGAN